MENTIKLDRVIAVRNDKTIYRDGDRCVKVFNSEYTKADVLHEALNHARIEETGIRIPKILEVTMVDEKWAIVTEYIKGKMLSQLIDENPEKMEEYLNLLVDLQIDIHGKNSLSFYNLKDRLNRKIRIAELDAITRYALHSRIEEMPKHNKICHGDLTPSNIIISENGKPYILDWSHASQGNAAADAVITYLYLGLNGREAEAEDFLNLYSVKSGTSKSYIKRWIPIIAAALSVDGNKREREFMLSHVKIRG